MVAKGEHGEVTLAFELAPLGVAATTHNRQGDGSQADDDEDDTGTEVVETKAKSLATTEKKEPSERTDDPVRIYLREMGSVELLSREGEIAIAKLSIIARKAEPSLCMSIKTSASLPSSYSPVRR